MREDTTYDITPKATARFLSIGMESKNIRGDLRASPSPAKLLQDMLANEPPLHPTMPGSVPAVLNRPCDELLPAAGRSMCDLLTGSKTDPAVITTLKDYAKELVRRGALQTQKAVGIVIYYAAIANALVFQGKRITTHPYENLREAYTELKGKPWISKELKGLFQKAGDVCGRRKPKPE